MASIKDYLTLSPSAELIKTPFVTPINFNTSFKGINSNEVEAYIRYFLVDNTPFVFREKPILFEQIIKYLADKLKVSIEQVKLIGSAKNGFSISRPPNYGKIFHNSDLDFVVFNEGLFSKLADEFFILKNEHETKGLGLNAANLFYWNEDIISIPYNIKRGFIDTHKIPNITLSPISSSISNLVGLIQENLLEIHSIKVKKPSVRVYKDYDSFIRRLIYNTKDVLKDVV